MMLKLGKQYKTGELVYILDTGQVNGRTKQLDPPWKGPGMVVQKIASYVYKVKLEKVLVTINHDRMKCDDRNIAAWLRRAKRRLENGENILETEQGDIYCLCRKGDSGGFMIQCDLCDEWYHGDGVNVTAEMAESFTTYHCPKCQNPRKH